MEKNKNISLDELFARAKGEKEIISQEDVRAIVSSVSPVQSITKTTSFISRKGFIMSGLGIVAAGTALFFSLGSQSGVVSSQGGSDQWSVASGQLPVVSGQLATPSTQHVAHSTTTTTVEPKKDVKESKTLKQEKVVIVKMGDGGMKINIKDDGTPTPKFDRPHSADGKLMAPIEVEKVGIVQSSEADLPKLGLHKEPNGDLLFKASQAGGKAMTIAIPVDGWGVKTNIITGKDAQTDVKLSPMIITDERGNRRFVNYADENTWVHMQRFNGEMPSGIVIDGGDTPNINVQNDEVSISVNNDKNVDGNVVRSRTNMRKKTVISDDSLHADDLSTLHKMKIDMTVDGENKDFNFNMNFLDSLKDMDVLVKDAMKKVKVAMKNVRIEMDSAKKALINIKLDKNFDLNGDIQDFDSAVKNLNKEVSSLMVIDRNFSQDEAESFDKGIGGLEGLDKELKAVEAKLSAKINTLVPVLVRKATEVTRNKEENRDYDNGVIMWFEPEYYWKQVGEIGKPYEVVFGNGVKLVNGTSHLATNAQDKQYNIAKGIISSVSIYPNPVRSTTTNIHYTLNEPRSVAFSVHDILGKKIVDCGSLAERPAGSYDFELNIGTVPAGIYLVVITTDKGEQSIQRIVVEK